MRMSTRGRYGVAALYELAANDSGGPLALRQIAETQGLSENYLEQLFLVLRRAGLVSGVRGAQGGYVLARPAAEIKVGDIIRALEGPVAPVACVGDPELCTREAAAGAGCPMRPVWVRLAECMTRVLDSISLSDLVTVSAEERAASTGACACDDCTTKLGRHEHG